jgi:hypothetical protein
MRTRLNTKQRLIFLRRPHPATPWLVVAIIVVALLWGAA